MIGRVVGHGYAALRSGRGIGLDRNRDQRRWSDGPAESTRRRLRPCPVSWRAMSRPPITNTPRLPPVDAATLRRLLLHEAQVHATPGRELRDLGDAILLHDPTDREPFWNRLEAVRWPVRADAFDRRLTEALVLFATLGRQPHIWASPLYDRPADLVARLHANGFSDMGPGNVMALADPAPSRAVVEAARGGRRSPSNGIGRRPATRLGRPHARSSASWSTPSTSSPSARLHWKPRRSPSLANPVFTHYVVLDDGVPAAVARRATFDGATYLSSIGTAGWARNRGFAGLVTASAVVGRGARSDRVDVSRCLRRQPGRYPAVRASRVRTGGGVKPRHAAARMTASRSKLRAFIERIENHIDRTR